MASIRNLPTTAAIDQNNIHSRFNAVNTTLKIVARIVANICANIATKWKKNSSDVFEILPVGYWTVHHHSDHNAMNAISFLSMPKILLEFMKLFEKFSQLKLIKCLFEKKINITTFMTIL